MFTVFLEISVSTRMVYTGHVRCVYWWGAVGGSTLYWYAILTVLFTSASDGVVYGEALNYMS